MPPDEFDDTVAAGNVPGSNQKFHPRHVRTKFLQDLYHDLFFATVGTSCYKDRPGAIESKFREKRGFFRRAHLAVVLIVFGVACDDHLVGIGAQLDHILGINRRLHAKPLHGIQHLCEHAAHLPVMADAAFTYAAVHHHDRDALLAGGPEKIGPQFGLHRHIGPRVESG